MKNWILVSMLMMVLSVSSSGCIFLAAGAASAGTAKWLTDKVTQEIDKPFDNVVNASRDALKSMDLEIYKDTRAKGVTQILAKYVDGRRVWIDIRPLAPANTQVDVRVGWVNGEEDARKILDKIVAKSKSWF